MVVVVVALLVVVDDVAKKLRLRGLLEPISSCGSYLESYSYGRGLIFFQDCRGDLGGELP